MEKLLVESGFKIFGLEISYYGLIIAVGIGLGIFIAIKNAEKRGLKGDDIITLALYAIPLAVLGARIYYCLFFEDSFSFVEFFKIWEGGMAIYGAVIGGAVGAVLFCLIHKKNFLAVADVACISLILGQGLGRIGCYFAGCCYGVEVTNPAFMWFPFAVEMSGVWHYSTFFYESFFNLIIFGVLLFLFRKKVNTTGVIFSLYILCYGVVRCIIETFRGDSLYIFNVIKVSQLLSAILIIVGIIMLVIIYTKKKKGVSNEENSPTKSDTNN